MYPDDSQRAGVQVFQLYEGKGFYHSLTQGHKYTFSIQGLIIRTKGIFYEKVPFFVSSNVIQ